jgi:thioredoxin 1
MNAIDVTEANFEVEVLQSDLPVLVEFGTGWSFPSRALDEVLPELAANVSNPIKVARVKLDLSPNLGLWYGIRCVPTIFYFVDGDVRSGIFGMASKNAMLSQLKAAIEADQVPAGARFAKS